MGASVEIATAPVADRKSPLTLRLRSRFFPSQRRLRPPTARANRAKSPSTILRYRIRPWPHWQRSAQRRAIDCKHAVANRPGPALSFFLHQSNGGSCVSVTNCQPGTRVLSEPGVSTLLAKPTFTSDRQCIDCSLGSSFSTSVSSKGHMDGAQPALAACSLHLGGWRRLTFSGETLLPLPQVNAQSCVGVSAPCSATSRVESSGLSMVTGPGPWRCLSQTLIQPTILFLPPETAPTLTSDRICTACDATEYFSAVRLTLLVRFGGDVFCPPWLIYVPAASNAQDDGGTCQLVTDCQPGQYVRAQATPISDRQCDACQRNASFSETVSLRRCLVQRLAHYGQLSLSLF